MRKMTSGEIETMYHLRTMGKTNAEIAAMLDRTLGCVRNTIGLEGTPRDVAEANYERIKAYAREKYWASKGTQEASEQGRDDAQEDPQLEMPFDDLCIGDDHAVLVEIRDLLKKLVDQR